MSPTSYRTAPPRDDKNNDILFRRFLPSLELQDEDAPKQLDDNI